MVINPIVGVYIPIIRIPIKGGMTIPKIYPSVKVISPVSPFRPLKIGLLPLENHLPTIDFPWRIFVSLPECNSKTYLIASDW